MHADRISSYRRASAFICGFSDPDLRHNSLMKKGLALGLLLLATWSWGENWPQWRGPALNGVSAEKNLPEKWSANENITWKLAVPSRSGATPIIWGDTVFL